MEYIQNYTIHAFCLLYPAGFPLFLFCPDRVAQDADPLNFNFHRITVSKRPHPGRSARQDQIAGFEGHHGRNIDDQLRHAEDHLARRGKLFDFAVHAAGDEIIGGIQISFNPGADRAKCIKALGARPLAVAALQVARGDIVGDGVAQNVVFNGFLFDPAPLS